MARRAESRLSEYQKKRDFNKTPEPDSSRSPAGGKGSGNNFVIQKHFASRLHFDLRLEIDGALASWAVPLGPTLDPKIRRLAVRTEDHPLAYATFEGEIPEGTYGAGKVEIWDSGTYEPLQDIDPAEGLADGHLKIELTGERLRGGFALVRTKSPEAPGRGRKKPAEQWLLIKEKDAAATGAFDPADVWVGSVNQPGGDGQTLPSKPQFSKPQLATEVDRPPSGQHWVHEIKYDGYRLQAVKDGSSVRLFTRAGNDWTAKLPGIREAVADLARDRLVLDGELVVLDPDGNADFGALQNDLKSDGRHTTFIVFDCLEVGRRDLKSRPWSVRNGELRALLARARLPLKYGEHLEGDGREIFAAAVGLGAEGIVSKHVERPWQSGRNRNWLKSKGERRGVFAIGGYRKSKARPFSSLLLGEPEGRRLIYRGRVGTGFSDKVLASLGEQLAKLEAESVPFISVTDDGAKDAVWIKPELYAEVAYGDMTADGHLRHAKFIRLVGKAPKKRDAAAPAVKVTNVDRILYPDAGLTKGDLLEYYQAVGAYLMPHIEDHFVSLIRAPDGNLDKAFFQRHEFAGMPDGIEVVRNMGRYNRYISINTHDGLLAAAQFSVLEIHPWGAKRSNPEHPDRLIFDLDPHEALPFKTVRSAARLVRDVLEAGALRSFPLLTGGKGVHVIAPLNESAGWDLVSGFAEKLARQLARAKPDLFVASAGKAKRKGRIFLDWQRNKNKATAIAPWSPRARPGAPVACPVTWDELGRAESAAAYDITRARRRLAQLKTDPWEGYWALDQTVPDL